MVLLAGATSNLLGQQSGPSATKAQQPTNKPPVKAQSGNAPITQAGAQAPANAKVPRPPANNLIISELSPELEEILRQWEIKSAAIKTLHGKHTRTVYNLVFEVEGVSKGQFWVETPDKGRIDLVGHKPGKDDKGAKSARLGKEGKPFTIQADRSEKWICNGEFVYVVNDNDPKEKTYEKIEIPPEDRGANIINSPLPFLFGMKATDMKRRFQLELLKDEKDRVILLARPRTLLDMQNYTKAMIILEKQRYIPTAVKLYDPNGQLETVYVFDEVNINEQGVKEKWNKLFKGNPFDATFLTREGYKLVLPKVDEVGQDFVPRNTTNPNQKGTGQRLATPPLGKQTVPRTANPGGSNLK